MLKKDEWDSESSCWNKAASDEPVFVLRANDPVASMVIRHWAQLAFGTHKSDKIAEARRCANAMDAWRREKGMPL